MYVEDWNIAKDENEILLLRFNARNNQFIIILYTPTTKKEFAFGWFIDSICHIEIIYPLYILFQ